MELVDSFILIGANVMLHKIVSVSFLGGVLMMAGCRDRENVPAVSPDDAAPSSDGGGKVEETRDVNSVSLNVSELTGMTWTGHACSLDMIDKGAPEGGVKKGVMHSFEGFVLDESNGPAGDFFFVLKGEAHSFALGVATGIERPDVGEFFKNPSLNSSGFEFSTQLKDVPVGDYNVVFVMERASGKFFCESGKSISVLD
ncbi:hypothetical protein [Stenotrophomonas sp. ATCM1_4]|uniref:hypothetical protein n=1 Tax=Stenotrophomonas sp. ATCM1_4 TaxID=2259330 RepID=UPI001052BC0F|nr:hypothetical protein [Stenotrophomonas sp. ATCM1_4]